MSLAEILVSQPSLKKIITLKGTQEIFLQIFINTFQRLRWTSEYKSYIWYFAVLLVQLICKCIYIYIYYIYYIISIIYTNVLYVIYTKNRKLLLSGH